MSVEQILDIVSQITILCPPVPNADLTQWICLQVGSNGQYQFRLYAFIFFTTFMCGINYYTQGKTNYHFATHVYLVTFSPKK